MKRQGAKFPLDLHWENKVYTQTGFIAFGIGRSQPKLNARESKTRHEHLAERN